MSRAPRCRCSARRPPDRCSPAGVAADAPAPASVPSRCPTDRSVNAAFVVVGAGSAFANEYVQKSYVAYYGRPADPAGLGVLGEPNGRGRRFAVVDHRLVRNLRRVQSPLRRPQLHRPRHDDLPADARRATRTLAGLAYYVGELQAGRKTLQTITLDVLNGASTAPDSTIVANKLDVANHFTGKVAAGCRLRRRVDRTEQPDAGHGGSGAGVGGQGRDRKSLRAVGREEIFRDVNDRFSESGSSELSPA